MRLADKKDFPILKNLWMDSFDEKPIFCEKFFQVRTSPERITLIEEGDEIVSALHMLPCYFYSAGFDIKGSNLVGAATFEKYRGKKYMERLIIESIRLMRDRGEVLCSLKPFLHSFYRKYGWEKCCRTYKYNFPAEKIKNFSGMKNDSNINIIRNISLKDITELNNLYEKYSPSVFLKRNEEDWDFFLWDIFTNESCIFISKYGYCICVIEEKHIKVVETVYSSESALFSLLNYINKEFGGKDIELNTLSMLNPDYNTAGQEDFTMIRIIDLKALSGKIPADHVNLKGGIYEVVDNAAPWNSGNYFLCDLNGKLIIEETCDKCDSKIDISELTGKIFNEANTIIFEGY